MIHRRTLTHLILVSFVLVTLVACGGSNAPAVPTLTSSPAAAATSTPSNPDGDATPAVIGGPGTFHLPEPGAHLDLLARYQVELVTQFHGELEEEPFERTTHLTLAYAGSDAQVTRLEVSATDAEPLFLLAGQVAGTRFVQSDIEAPCSSLVDEQETEAPIFGDPWRELPAVYGAELVGMETLHDFETEHYSFDQRALRWAADTTAQGELWIAKGGGFLVRYRLTMQAPPGVLGAAGGQKTWQFDLTPLPEDALLLPEGCAPVLTDFVLLPDAAAILRLPQYLSYHTTSSLAAAVEFYRQALTTEGWEEQDAFDASSERTVLFFVRPIWEGEVVTVQEVAAITLQPVEDGLKVGVQLLRAEVPPPETGE